ncbi:HAD-IA family hydrolase [Fodinibacter luteus]|uniref:HAD-IA family hydrolase n=1 Tax=Fodinibacter luteus TaxID=552064 RepID=A0ABP8KRE9_9MICO
MIRNLIWDFDGTLFDTYPAIANSLRAAVGDLAVPPSFEEVRDMALVSIDGCLSTLSMTYALPLEELEAGFERHYGNVTPDDQPPFTGVREVCELICARGGLNLIVTHRRRSGMDRLLAAHGLADLIADTVSCYDDEYPRKPDPAAFLMLIKRHHLRFDQTLAVGDRELDVLAAHAAGLPAALFAPTPTTVTAEVVLADFDALHQIVAGQRTPSAGAFDGLG